MRRMIVAAALAGVPLMCQAAEFPLKRVVLSTSGLAQFTHAGEAEAGSVIELPVRIDQVDDVLKSLTVFDAAGAVGAVSLPGKTPLAELFRDLPFDKAALELPTGAVERADRRGSGDRRRRHCLGPRLPRRGGNRPAARQWRRDPRHRLTLLTDKGFVQAILEELTAVRFADAGTRAQIDRALSGLAANRAKDRRTLAIAFGGEGTRKAGFSYVVAAPVWKTSYRLVLPKEGGKARLQGWGILENLTGGDWKDVDLTLVSGNPVALKQALYSAVFVQRPEIPVTSSLRIVPRKDEADETSGGIFRKQPQARGFAVAGPPPRASRRGRARARTEGGA